MNSKKEKIEVSSIVETLSRGTSSINNFETPYLDKVDGSIVWINHYHQIEKNICIFPTTENFYKGVFKSYPARYLKIPTISKLNLQNLMIIFLRSDWTDDRELLKVVRKCARCNSIKQWLTNLRTCDQLNIDPNKIIALWDKFLEASLKRMVEHKLKKNNVDFEWSDSKDD